MENRKKIFITGAASGIGRATAIFFARQGWYVGLYDMNLPGLKLLIKEIGKENGCYCRMDVTDIGSVRRGMSHFAKNTGGRMDVLFNNAGIIAMGPMESINLKLANRIIDVNLKGAINCIHAGLDLLKTTKCSHIINMSSASSLYGTPYLAVYSATKSALSSLTESMNLELDQYRIIVSDIRAPYVRTPLLDKDVKAPSINNLGIRLMPEDVAKSVFKAANGFKVHNDTKGIKPLRFLLMIPAPKLIKRRIMKILLLEK